MRLSQTLAFFLLAGLVAMPARAEEKLVTGSERQHDAAREALRKGQIVPLADILQMVQAKLPGDVIEVELNRERGRWVYEVEILPADGRLQKLYFDAATKEPLARGDMD